MILLALNHYRLKAMTESRFLYESGGLVINKPLFYISSYGCIILATLTAYFFQAQTLNLNPGGKWIPLWKALLGG